jgi:hypothetical protein
MSDFQEGNYDNCTLLEAVFGDSDYGPQWYLTFQVGDAKRTVYLGTGTDRVGNDGKTDEQKTAETLHRIGWNKDFDNPKFEQQVFELYMKVNNAGKERWYISNGNFKPKPTAEGQRQKFLSAYRATVGSSPVPSATKPNAAAPARPSQAPSRPATKPDDAAITNTDEAWAAVIKGNDKITSDKFYETIEKYEKKNRKKEAAFSPEDWSAIVLDLITPF